MSSSDIAVSVRGLSKSYTIAHDQEKHVTLAETMLSRLKNPLRRPKTETFWALKDIEFDIRKGDVVGIIGRNGAGKSTLLKVLSRITEPTAGQIDLYGRVGSLLEVGTGFHPELTGRENVFLNGAILGMSKAEIRRQFDAIVDFAGVEQFLDTPVKRYSSGMYVRLAFAVAAHLESEILIVDEVLAVGDAEFQRKCLGKMKDVASGGKTVLLVSHDHRSVAANCKTALLLNKGCLVLHGLTETALELYAGLLKPERRFQPTCAERLGTALEIQNARVECNYTPSNRPIRIDFDLVTHLTTLPRLNAVLEIIDSAGIAITTATSQQSATELPLGHTTISFELLSPRLKPGKYYANIAVEEPETLDRIDNAVSFEVVEPEDRQPAGVRLAGDKSLVLADIRCAVRHLA